ncbi:putative ATP-grasp-modified RiPP [Streptomyces sp. B1866]|uniref:putative ATP-grasp-modified RiPP n=1 Tax=Streptomyces sp. B1866 TaxID=3075431 RepID=UPI00288DECFB|nr:putative ATP-grasp-modified RiPP [Streptomyces sp. B1866]MDT3398140.1 putative ATP-grasp-modified RiPP [Streptomyces sp. B1866]
MHHLNRPSPRPWGLSRIGPLGPPEEVPAYRVELDPQTQTARYSALDGRPLHASQHRKTKRATERRTRPQSGPDGNTPNGQTDHEQDEEQQDD